MLSDHRTGTHAFSMVLRERGVDWASIAAVFGGLNELIIAFALLFGRLTRSAYT